CRSAPVFISDWPRMADGLLQLSIAEFEYPRSDLPDTVEFAGPVLPVAAGDFQPPDWWADVLNATTVVHVTQGTFDNADLDQLISPTLDALGDHDDLLVVATTGGRPGQRWRG
ncbi:UDP-glucuronosyltransferase, partial [Mycobacterium sp. ITM-2017-0098]